MSLTSHLLKVLAPRERSSAILLYCTVSSSRFLYVVLHNPVIKRQTVINIQFGHPISYKESEDRCEGYTLHCEHLRY